MEQVLREKDHRQVEDSDDVKKDWALQTTLSKAETVGQIVKQAGARGKANA